MNRQRLAVILTQAIEDAAANLGPPMQFRTHPFRIPAERSYYRRYYRKARRAWLAARRQARGRHSPAWMGGDARPRP